MILFDPTKNTRKNQVEPRCAALDLWSLCLQRTVAWLQQCGDDEQFDLAAWFHKHSDRHFFEWWSFLLYFFIFRQSKLHRIFNTCCCKAALQRGLG